MAVQDLLVRHGFAVKSLLSGTAALAAIDDNPDEFDVVLSDNHMVGMSGMELCVELSARARTIL